MAAFSERLDALAQQAITEAIGLDEEDRLAQDKARPGNKANFRP